MEVYRPAEDSYLLAKHVERLVMGKVLDMGTGSGIQAVTAAKKKEVSQVTAVDINPSALEAARGMAKREGVLSKMRFVLSDLFDDIEECFDWIIFNTPYLPSEGEADEVSWTGGKTGSEVIKRFLENASSHLYKGGSILILYSSLSEIVEKDFAGYAFKIVEEKTLFFEKITCMKLSLS